MRCTFPTRPHRSRQCFTILEVSLHMSLSGITGLSQNHWTNVPYSMADLLWHRQSTLPLLWLVQDDFGFFKCGNVAVFLKACRLCFVFFPSHKTCLFKLQVCSLKKRLCIACQTFLRKKVSRGFKHKAGVSGRESPEDSDANHCHSSATCQNMWKWVSWLF